MKCSIGIIKIRERKKYIYTDIYKHTKNFNDRNLDIIHKKTCMYIHTQNIYIYI